MPVGASVLRPLKPMTLQAASFGAGSSLPRTAWRSAGSRASRPRAIMLWVLPPPIACERRKTDEPAEALARW